MANGRLTAARRRARSAVKFCGVPLFAKALEKITAARSSGQLIDRRRGDAPGQLLIFEPDRPVQHDHDQPALGPHVVRDDIGRHVAHPRRPSGDGSGSASSTGTNATIGLVLPSSRIVKSAAVRLRTGRRFLSSTETSTCTTSTPARKVGCDSEGVCWAGNARTLPAPTQQRRR